MANSTILEQAGTYASSYTIGGVTFTFRKQGKIVVVTTSGSNTNALATNASLGSTTVDSDFFPAGTTAEIRYFLVTATTSVQFNLTTSGTFSIGYPSAQINASTTWRGTITYYAAN